MIKIGDEMYYIDTDALSEIIYEGASGEGTIVEKEIKYEQTEEGSAKTNVLTVEKEMHKPQEIDSMKYDLIGRMLDIILNEVLEGDDTLNQPTDLQKAPSHFVFAFNTLLKLKIIKII